MFAEDAGLLPGAMFTQMLEQARKRPGEFAALARDLFRAMSGGGRVGFEAVAWFNGGLFDDDTALPLAAGEIETALRASALDWSEIDPSILGTLFERGLDPGKRSQLGAHYTDRDKIMRIVEPVIARPWLAEWEAAKARIAESLAKAESARVAAARTRRRAEAEALGLQRGFPAVGPANAKGIELNAYAAELARVSVWIGEAQWMRRKRLHRGPRPDRWRPSNAATPFWRPTAASPNGRTPTSSSATRPSWAASCCAAALAMTMRMACAASMARDCTAMPIWSATGSTRRGVRSPGVVSRAPGWSPRTPFAADATVRCWAVSSRTARFSTPGPTSLG